MKYTNEQIAEDFGLWAEYVDPDGVLTKEEFDNMSIEDRLFYINELED